MHQTYVSVMMFSQVSSLLSLCDIDLSVGIECSFAVALTSVTDQLLQLTTESCSCHDDESCLNTLCFVLSQTNDSYVIISEGPF